jgi:glycosyltransferase involved in cell wall biosynthesis
MRVSVIIPCHNAARWIAQAIQSAAAQTHKPHEIIVIDDASTDNSVEVIKATGVDVRLLHVQERNAAAARNRGIETATGEWIAFLDADDYWYDHHLQAAAKILGNSDDVAYISNFDVERHDGRIQSLPTPHPLSATKSGLSHESFLPFMTGNCLFGHSTVLIRVDRLQSVGLFDIEQKRRHDIDLWLRVIHNATWTYGATAPSVYRLETPGSISRHLSSCEYYFLRALLKNYDNYRGPEFEYLIRTSARRSMSLTFVDGPDDLFPEVRRLAWPFLDWPFKFAYRAASLAPFALKLGIRCKRQLRNSLSRT